MNSSAWIVTAAALVGGCARGGPHAPAPVAATVAPDESPAAALEDRRPDAAPDAAMESALETARPLFYRAVEGDAGALRRCERTLAHAAADGEGGAKVLAYRGGCEMLRAARAPLPWDKGKHARAGLTMLDRAVEAAPQDVEVRFVRGMTSYHLPGFFGRSKVAAADLATAAAQAEAAAADGRMDRRLAAAALFHHGVLLRRNGKPDAARNAWRRAVGLGRDTPGGAAAARKLGEAGYGS